MARLFDDGSSQYLYVNSTPITAAPFTMACWFNTDDDTIAQALMYIGDKDTDGDDRWQLAAHGIAGAVRFQAADGGDANADTTSDFSANTWHHACGIELASNSRKVLLDGANLGTDSTEKTPDNADRIAVGAIADPTPAGYASGRIAEAAMWNVALSEAEGATLAQGFSPLFVQPQNLVAYYPLIRDDDNDWIGGYDLTATNTPTVATHPPKVIYPNPFSVSAGFEVANTALGATATLAGVGSLTSAATLLAYINLHIHHRDTHQKIGTRDTTVRIHERKSYLRK
jgi:hypothetical protein